MSEPGRLLLLIEDELKMRRLLRPSLSAQGFRLLEVGTAEEGVTAAKQEMPELIILDLGLPDGDGVSVTRRIRSWSSSVPIIVISARGLDRDKVEALDAGADDYITKPFGVAELLARIRVAFRHIQPEPTATGSAYRFGALRIDVNRREVLLGEREIHLTPIEYKLLVMLAENAGKVLTHRQILAYVWGQSDPASNHYVVVRMADLRKKIEPNPHRPVLLVTEPGVGYRLRVPPAVEPR